MRLLALFLGCTLAGCGREVAKAPIADSIPVPRLAIGFVGDWLTIAPSSLRGDTLRLGIDSSATGVIPWSRQGMVRVSHWKIRYGSKDSVAARADWRYGFKNGGDTECVFGDAPGCISMPLLCLGPSGESLCVAFLLKGDSLLLSSGLRYVRVRNSADNPGRVGAEQRPRGLTRDCDRRLKRIRNNVLVTVHVSLNADDAVTVHLLKL